MVIWKLLLWYDLVPHLAHLELPPDQSQSCLREAAELMSLWSFQPFFVLFRSLSFSIANGLTVSDPSIMVPQFEIYTDQKMIWTSRRTVIHHRLTQTWSISLHAHSGSTMSSCESAYVGKMYFLCRGCYKCKTASTVYHCPRGASRMQKVDNDFKVMSRYFTNCSTL